MMFVYRSFFLGGCILELLSGKGADQGRERDFGWALSIGLAALPTIIGTCMCRAMQELVDGPCHTAWAKVACCLLPAAAARAAAWQTGAAWQAAIR